MSLFEKLLRRNTSVKNTVNDAVNCGGRLDYNPSGDSEYGFYTNCYAKYEDGVVYNCGTMPSVSDVVIGYYEKDESGSYTVWDMDRNRKVGLIDGNTGEVTLCLMDMYERVKEFRPFIKMPSAMTWRCVKVEKGKIMDLSSGRLVGNYKGDAIGAAAAFVCLSYEYVQDGKFHGFYYDWMM